MKADLILVIGFIAAVCGLAGAVLGLLNQRRAMKMMVMAEDAATIAQKISVNVDGNLARMFARQDQLSGILQDEGIAIPPMPPEKTLRE
jgi:hypothetical protein